MSFGGFGEETFRFFEQVEQQPSWDYVSSLRPEWESHVHLPMEQLLEALRPEFGSDVHAYNLHRDPYLCSHQVGLVSIAPSIALRVVLSVEGLVAEGVWFRSSREQVGRFRRAVADETSGPALARIVGELQRSSFLVDGRHLASRPRGWAANHPRLELAWYTTLLASRQIGPEVLGSGPECLAAVSATWRELVPLISWLVENLDG